MRLRRLWFIVKQRARVILSILAIYISVTGLVTFSLFITEESIQMATFGTWPAQEAKDWYLVREGCERIKDTNRALKLINNCLGWIQPLAFFAYRSYGKSTDSYVAGLEAKIFANAPEIFEGRKITASFTPQEVRDTPDGYMHTNRRVTFISKERLPAGVSCRITGLVSVEGNKVVIKEPDEITRQK
ncbi:MAG TPA: hypothetical protein PLM79_17870 [Syntrophobacteraceae bacterium]|nr:hypothetical protein [Syntrophobacteraceae bacterium]